MPSNRSLKCIAELIYRASRNEQINMESCPETNQIEQSSPTFELVRHFSIASFVSVVTAIILATTVLTVFYRRLALSDLAATGERQNVALTQAFLNTLLPQLRAFLAIADRVDDHELKSHPETSRLHQAVIAQMHGVPVVKVKLYDLRGRTVFSTEAKQIGEDKKSNPGFLAARAGEVISEITHRDKFSAFEGVIENRDLISSYVPIRHRSFGSRVEAVFELYQDVTPLLNSITETQWFLTLGVILVLGSLYLVLMFIVRRADNIMKRQEIERQSAEHDLARRTKELERSYSDIQILHEIGCVILRTPDQGAALQQILACCLQSRAFDVGLIRLLKPDTQKYQLAAHLGYRNPANVESHHERFNDGLSSRMTAKMIAAREPVVDENVQEGDGLRTFKKENVHAAVFVPVRAGDQILGVLQLGSRAPRKFERDELRFLANVGNLIGIAAQKNQMFEAVVLAKGELEFAVKKLERSNTELQQFAYVASHDLQEPLRMITGYTNLLAKRYKGKFDSSADEFIGYAVDGANRMRVLINDLLTYSRVHSQRKKPVPTDCERVLSHTLMGLQMAIQESGATISHDPLPTVYGDDVQVGQLFQNLIGNAIKFRGNDAPAVHIGCERRQNDWLFSVRDNGIGIDPQHAERIFAIFQRLHHREEYPGTGIGLAVCKRIVERHSGKIWTQSEMGRGSTFYFTWPISDPEQLSQPDPGEIG
jgi:signal transduction histidine kinase